MKQRNLGERRSTVRSDPARYGTRLRLSRARAPGLRAWPRRRWAAARAEGLRPIRTRSAPTGSKLEGPM